MSRSQSIWEARRALALGLMLGWSFRVRAAEDRGRNIAVLYPDIGEPYRSVFAAIIGGIEDQANGRVASFAVGGNASAQDMASELRRRDVKTLIALGRNGLKLAAAMDRQWAVVAGGVIAVPDVQAREWPVQSLAPDPSLLFARLKAMMPGARRVMVVYDPRQNDWLMRLAREAAKAQGLDLLVFEAADLKTAVHHYKDVFASADTRRDVLWLPQDSTTVDEAVVPPMVLEESWGRGLAVFSSNVGHVRRGVLFALYPDNTEMGRGLARQALNVATGSGVAQPGVSPLKEVLLAVNTRTASHLGINVDTRRLRVEMVFPEP